jgi:hypothetical protein
MKKSNLSELKYPYFYLFFGVSCALVFVPTPTKHIIKPLESRWSPLKCEIFCVKWVEWRGLHILQVECLESTWNPPGFRVEFEKYLAGPPAKKIHMDSTWTP